MRPFLILPFLILTGCGGSKPGAPKGQQQAPPPPKVKVVETKKQDVPIGGEWVGTMDGMVIARIKAQVTGYLLHQHYQEGSRVSRGQLMFELDPRPAQATVAQARGQLAQANGQVQQAYSQRRQAEASRGQAVSQLSQAKAALEQAKGQYEQTLGGLQQAQANQQRTQLDEDKYRPLAERKAVTQQELDNAVQLNNAAKAQVKSAAGILLTAKGAIQAAQAQIEAANSTIRAADAQIGTADANIASAQAAVQTAQAQVEQAELNLSYTRITSPIDGIAGVAKAQVGDLIMPANPEPLTEVSTINPIKVTITMPEQEYLESLKRHGDRDASLRTMRFDMLQADGSKYPHSGHFFSEDRNVAVTTGAIKVVLTFPNPGGTLKPGQYARVRATRYIEKGVVMVPQRAVSELLDRHQVAVVGEDKKVSLVPVVVGERVGTNWIVKKGLQPGQWVVAEGTQKVGPGATVDPERVTESSEPKK